MSSKPCAFCDPANFDHRTLVLLRHTRVIPSKPRLMPYHLLVVPLRHVEKPTELTPEERMEVFNVAILVQDLILRNKLGTGCDISQHCRPFLPQSSMKVDHVHIHVRPRTFEDEYYRTCQITEVDLFRKYSIIPEEEMRLLRKVFAGAFTR